MLGLGLVVACGGAGNGCSTVGVVGVGVGLDGVAAATGAGIEGAGSVSDAVAIGIDVWEAGSVGRDDVGVDNAASAAAVAVGIVECVRIAVDSLRGRRGVSDVGSMVEEEGVC